MTTKLDQLVDRLNAVCRLEIEIPCLLTGFYLEDVEIAELAPLLSKEDIREDSVGSYDKVPVHRKYMVSELDRGEVGDYEGLVYSFLRLDSALLREPPSD